MPHPKSTMKETYKLKVRCGNCDFEQEIEIPVGKRFTEASKLNGNFARIGGTAEGYFSESHPKCSNCGCGELYKTYLK